MEHLISNHSDSYPLVVYSLLEDIITYSTYRTVTYYIRSYINKIMKLSYSSNETLSVSVQRFRGSLYLRRDTEYCVICIVSLYSGRSHSEPSSDTWYDHQSKVTMVLVNILIKFCYSYTTSANQLTYFITLL